MIDYLGCSSVQHYINIINNVISVISKGESCVVHLGGCDIYQIKLDSRFDKIIQDNTLYKNTVIKYNTIKNILKDYREDILKDYREDILKDYENNMNYDMILVLQCNSGLSNNKPTFTYTIELLVVDPQSSYSKNIYRCNNLKCDNNETEDDEVIISASLFGNIKIDSFKYVKKRSFYIESSLIKDFNYMKV